MERLLSLPCKAAPDSVLPMCARVHVCACGWVGWSVYWMWSKCWYIFLVIFASYFPLSPELVFSVVVSYLSVDNKGHGRMKLGTTVHAKYCLCDSYYLITPFFFAYLMRSRGLQGAAHGQFFTHKKLVQGLTGFARNQSFPRYGEKWGFLEEASILV